VPVKQLENLHGLIKLMNFKNRDPYGTSIH
jgi:hypothetical protein